MPSSQVELQNDVGTPRFGASAAHSLHWTSVNSCGRAASKAIQEE
jgi:hypothetical protein